MGNSVDNNQRIFHSPLGYSVKITKVDSTYINLSLVASNNLFNQE